MATKTRAQMIDKALQRIGVLAIGQTSSAEDASIVGDALDSLHSQLKKRGLCPFATSAFPDWAQEPFSKILASEIGPYFGMRDPALKLEGERELSEQNQGRKQLSQVRSRSF